MVNKRSEDVVGVIRTRMYIEMMIATAIQDEWRKEIEAAARRIGISDINGLKANELNLSNEELMMVMTKVGDGRVDRLGCCVFVNSYRLLSGLSVVVVQVKDGNMTIDQALEMVKAQHVQQQDAKAKAAQERAVKAKEAAEARRKKKAKKVHGVRDRAL